jgi:TetR/AcrR family transcriptional regulator, acrEF/envCD operon repressor
MNQRKQRKAETREHILTVAKRLFTERGALSTTTLDIAREAGVANGTVFLHFGSRDGLLTEVFERESKRLVREAHARRSESTPPVQVLREWLDALTAEEDFFGVILRELPFYPPQAQTSILSVQIVTCNLFYRSLESRLPEERIRPVIDAVFALVEHYLRLKPLLTVEPEILPRFRDEILQTYERLIHPEEK